MLLLLLRFKICRWLSREEFNKIIRFATYSGREQGCSIFLVNISSLRDVEKIVNFIEKYDGELYDESKKLISKLYEEARVVEIDKISKHFVLRSKAYLYDYIRVYRDKGLVYYSRLHRGFLVKPYAVIDVIKRLDNEGFRVIDKSGLIHSKNRLDGIKLDIRLRPYQDEALRRWKANGYRGVIALPTGTGKTIIGIGAIFELKLPTLIVVYTREQLMEWSTKLKKFVKGSARYTGEFYSEKKDIRLITITTYQSAYRNIDLLYDKFSLLIVDEAHHLPADKFKAIAEGILAPFRLGLSATPHREDGKHEELFNLIGGIVYSKSLTELMQAGFVAPFEVIPILVPLERDKMAKYRELRKRFFALSKGREIQELIRAAALGDNSARQALKIMNDIRNILIESNNKINKIKEIVDKELNNNSKIIIFTQYIKQAKMLGKILGVPVITSKTNKNARTLIFNLFKHNRYRVLILTTLGDEGIDIPDANVGIIVSGTSSTRQFIQRLGRLLRPAEGKTSRLYYIALKDTQEERKMKKILLKVQEYLNGNLM